MEDLWIQRVGKQIPLISQELELHLIRFEFLDNLGQKVQIRFSMELG